MGRGDMIQFARYAPLFANQFDEIVLLVPQDLLDLFRASRLCRCGEWTTDLNPSRDVWMPMMDLLRSGATRLFLATVSVISQLLPDSTNGPFVWSGEKKQFATHCP